ncbi:MAG: DNA topoisomerase I [Thermoplasmatota archaeon]
MTTLVICEKNNAASRIAYLLSDGDQDKEYYYKVPYYEFDREGEHYIVVGLRGHILEYDYPDNYNNWSKVDEEELIDVEPNKEISAKRIANLVKKMGDKSDSVIVATDYDREGELIGLEAVRLLIEDRPDLEVKRARFSSLSKGEIESAFGELEDVDEKLAESAETRQVVDLAWGAVLTRFLSKTAGRYGKNFISAGRVQTPTLAIVVDKDEEIDNFEPDPFWKITALLEKDFQFEASFDEDRVWDEERAEKIYEKVENAETGTTTSFKENKKQNRPPSPFNTTQFVSDANKLGLSPAQAMRTAENLYTEGWISYPRTENTVYPKSLNYRQHLKKLTDSELGDEIEEILTQKKITATRGKKQTTDHPPIYPIRPATKKQLNGRDWKVYELILRRFLATLSPNAVSRSRRAEFDIEGEKFFSKGYEIIKEGWRKYYPYYKVNETKVPFLSEGDIVDVKDVDLTEDETKPPNRYSQGSLIRKMENLGLGTKSTRHNIIQKLFDRGFLSGKVPRSTQSGKSVVETLENHAEMVTRAEMTKTLEEDMNKIAEGKQDIEEVIEESREMLTKVIKSLKEEKEEIRKELKESFKEQNAVGKCPECGGTLQMRKTNKGRFVGCSGYPDCRNTYNVPRSGKVKPASGECPECGSPKIMVYHYGDTEELCIDLNCKYSKDKRYRGPCPECGGDLREMRSYRGKRFLGCSNYPDCKNTYPVPQKGKIEYTGEKCTECDSPILKIPRKTKSAWEFCPNPDCPENKKE